MNGHCPRPISDEITKSGKEGSHLTNGGGLLENQNKVRGSNTSHYESTKAHRLMAGGCCGGKSSQGQCSSPEIASLNISDCDNNGCDRCAPSNLTTEDTLSVKVILSAGQRVGYFNSVYLSLFSRTLCVPS